MIRKPENTLKLLKRGHHYYAWQTDTFKRATYFEAYRARDENGKLLDYYIIVCSEHQRVLWDNHHSADEILSAMEVVKAVWHRNV